MATIPVAGQLATTDPTIGTVAKGTTILVATTAARDALDASFLQVGQECIVQVPDTDPVNSKYQVTSLGPTVWTLETGGGGGSVDSIVAGTGITVDATDPANPIVTADAPTFTQVNDALALADAFVSIGAQGFQAGQFYGEIADIRLGNNNVFLCYNPTPADAVNTAQYSPTMRWAGAAWKSNAAAESQQYGIFAALHAAPGAAAITGKLQFTSQNTGGALVSIAALAGDGRISNVTDPTGAQDAATKTYVDANTPAIAWTAAKTWTQVYAEIVAAGGSALVLLGRNNTITTGAYDLSKVVFQGSSRSYSFLLIQNGATIDSAGSGVLQQLILRDVDVEIEGALLANAGDSIVLVCSNGSIITDSGTTFPGVGYSFTCELYNSTITVAGTALFSGGSLAKSFYSRGVSTLTGVILAGAGTITMSSDAQLPYNGMGATQFPLATISLTIRPVTVNSYATGSLPNPVTGIARNAIAWDTTTLQFKFNDGSAWQTPAGSAPTYAQLVTACAAANANITIGTYGWTAGKYTATILALSTAQTVGMLLQNTTNTNTIQYSPALAMYGYDDSGHANGWHIQARPVATSRGDLVFSENRDGTLAEVVYLRQYTAGTTRFGQSTAFVEYDGANNSIRLVAHSSIYYAMQYNQNGHEWNVAAGGIVYGPVTQLTFRPGTDGVQYSGRNTYYWHSTWSHWFNTKMGAQLTAADTITPTSGMHHVTGATTINTIATTNIGKDADDVNASNPRFTIFADDGTITVGNSGNVYVGVAIPINTAQDFVYDFAAAKWFVVA